MLHLMIDLETLGTSPRAGVIQMSAVLFHDDTKYNEAGVFDKHYSVIQNKMANRTISPDTLDWWQKGDRAEKFARHNGEGLHLLQECATEFRAWYDAFPKKPSCIWSNGASFDLPIMRDLFEQFGGSGKTSTPWPYWNERCFRTVTAPEKAAWDAFKKSYQFMFGQGAHDGLFDARMQAEFLVQLIQSGRARI